MAVEEVRYNGLIGWTGRGCCTNCFQEFSIEIPDKDADAIHSGTLFQSGLPRVPALIISIVEQAVSYILSQPDGMHTLILLDATDPLTFFQQPTKLP